MKKGEKKRGIRKYFTEALKYVSKSRNYIYAIVVLFVISAFVGFAFPEKFTFFDEILKKIIEKTEGLGWLDLIVFIFKNNLQSAFWGIASGAVFGIFPILSGAINGTVLGYVMNLVFAKNGIGEFWRILPHGIFELPAIFIALGLGVRLGMFVFAKEKMKELKRRAYNSLLVLVFIILPLLVIAAIIEGTLIILYK